MPLRLAAICRGIPSPGSGYLEYSNIIGQILIANPGNGSQDK